MTDQQEDGVVPGDVKAVRKKLLEAITERPENAVARKMLLWKIRRIVKKCPAVLTAGKPNPLQYACFRRSTLEVIKLLVELNPETAKMVTEHGDTPLHLACCTRGTSLEVFTLLIEAYPDALIKANQFRETPLHLACKHHCQFPELLLLLLSHCPPQVFVMLASGGMKSDSDWGPLHYAVYYNVPTTVIRVMIRMYPKGLRIFSKFGASPLDLACISKKTSLGLIKLLIRQDPVLCLIPDKTNNFPMENAVLRERTPEVLFVLQVATKEAAMAVLVCAASCRVRMPLAVMGRIETLVPDFPCLIDYMTSNETTHQLLDDRTTQQLLDDRERLEALLYNIDFQEMLQHKAYYDLVAGVYRMAHAQSKTSETERKHHVRILNSVCDSVDCRYLHLRNNPSLCQPK
jgi:hypothetical protein